MRKGSLPEGASRIDLGYFQRRSKWGIGVSGKRRWEIFSYKKKVMFMASSIS